MPNSSLAELKDEVNNELEEEGKYEVKREQLPVASRNALRKGGDPSREQLLQPLNPENVNGKLNNTLFTSEQLYTAEISIRFP